ncbi:MAG: hypothetical protein ABL866_14160 [Devosia sp.]
MPWIKFTADFDFRPKPAVTLAYRAGQVVLVTTACAKAAIDKGRAERTSKLSELAAVSRRGSRLAGRDSHA